MQYHFDLVPSTALPCAHSARSDGDMNMYEVFDFSAAQISVYTGRGTLIESQGPSWFVGGGSEHSALYQYQLYKAKNVSGVISVPFGAHFLALCLLLTHADISRPLRYILATSKRKRHTISLTQPGQNHLTRLRIPDFLLTRHLTTARRIRAAMLGRYASLALPTSTYTVPACTASSRTTTRLESPLSTASSDSFRSETLKML